MNDITTLKQVSKTHQQAAKYIAATNDQWQA
jgi:hypothetical protein